MSANTRRCTTWGASPGDCNVSFSRYWDTPLAGSTFAVWATVWRGLTLIGAMVGAGIGPPKKSTISNLQSIARTGSRRLRNCKLISTGSPSCTQDGVFTLASHGGPGSDAKRTVVIGT